MIVDAILDEVAEFTTGVADLADGAEPRIQETHSLTVQESWLEIANGLIGLAVTRIQVAHDFDAERVRKYLAERIEIELSR